MSQPFDPASRAERALAVEQERLARLTNTRVAYGDVVDPPATGRWAKPARPDDPSKLYPWLPGGSQYAGPQVGVEEPFGIDIQYVEPCGTEEEIARSIAAVPCGSTDADLSNIGSATLATGLPLPPSGDPSPFNPLAGSSTAPGNSASSPFDAAPLAPVATRTLSATPFRRRFG
jgi:hypothetical protein